MSAPARTVMPRISRPWAHRLLALLALAPAAARAADEAPTDWIDPDTGHRIVRLSR